MGLDSSGKEQAASTHAVGPSPKCRWTKFRARSEAGEITWRDTKTGPGAAALCRAAASGVESAPRCGRNRPPRTLRRADAPCACSIQCCVPRSRIEMSSWRWRTGMGEGPREDERRAGGGRAAVHARQLLRRRPARRRHPPARLTVALPSPLTSRAWRRQRMVDDGGEALHIAECRGSRVPWRGRPSQIHINSGCSRRNGSLRLCMSLGEKGSRPIFFFFQSADWQHHDPWNVMLESPNQCDSTTEHRMMIHYGKKKST